MPLSVDWPSLADELRLADALFGRRGQALLVSWLEGEVARVNDTEFARSPITSTCPECPAEDYLHRRICTSSGTLLGGIRFLRARHQPSIRGDHCPQLR